MKALIQRVSQASVEVAGNIVGSIEGGILLLVGFEPNDSEAKLAKMADKVLAYRIFSDAHGKMNMSLRDTGGGLLVVSQFTLAANTQKGLRPSFSSAAAPEQAQENYAKFVNILQTRHQRVATGKFGADMKVALVNDGPVSFMLAM